MALPSHYFFQFFYRAIFNILPFTFHQAWVHPPATLGSSQSLSLHVFSFWVPLLVEASSYPPETIILSPLKSNLHHFQIFLWAQLWPFIAFSLYGSNCFFLGSSPFLPSPTYQSCPQIGPDLSSFYACYSYVLMFPSPFLRQVLRAPTPLLLWHPTGPNGFS
jgi:hypothetical protein